MFFLWKQGKFFLTLYCLNPCFCYFLDINDFCSRSAIRGAYWSHFAISVYVSAIFWTSKTYVFVMEEGEIFHNTLLFQSMFLLLSWHKLLLLSFSKQEILFITLFCFNPCFCYFIHISNFRFRSGSRGSSS